MSKGNDKKAKAEKTKPTVSVSSYKAAQGSNGGLAALSINGPLCLNSVHMGTVV